MKLQQLFSAAILLSASAFVFAAPGANPQGPQTPAGSSQPQSQQQMQMMQQRVEQNRQMMQQRVEQNMQNMQQKRSQDREQVEDGEGVQTQNREQTNQMDAIE